MHNAECYYKDPVRIRTLHGPENRGSANCVTDTLTAKQLKNLLNSFEDGDLRDIVGRARRMSDLAAALAAALPADQAAGVVAANVRDDGELVVIAASPAWASRLRYETAALLEAARAAGIAASSCRIRVSRP